ncbi:UbiA-domain-containing protein [Pseudovirgaria hyperparasitica]|uniref:UbiA-domain-containing protein n=1 Tax=Pseudovirgaria hyperparasitica TaxID=470096 RepID=A0A6A6VVA3_9PEZI|nr:UbiA-domain-containing protein [Pseudovirgaria hyperparasitica]KAF2753654.1 UbiA-domain-containing protein [Pseudovirgaria hyperparasitica]
MSSTKTLQQRKISKATTAATSPGSETETKHAGNYGGNSVKGWVGYLPQSWVPYIQLARLSPPAGLFLIYFPHAFGLLLAAIKQRSDPSDVLFAAGKLLAGSFFVSNAIHIWNDLIDAPLDAKVERTRHRPIPRGAVSPSAALVFTATQAAGAAYFLPTMEGDTWQNFLYSVPGILGWTYYPYAKRQVPAPQAVLGFCLAWGNVMGEKTMGVEAFTTGLLGSNSVPAVQYGSAALFAAVLLWSMIYDTVYAHQDLEDDLKNGIFSLAVLCRGKTKVLLWLLLALMVGSLVGTGIWEGLGAVYYLGAVGGAAASLGSMIIFVDLKDSESCWWWFGNGFWYAGGAIATGLAGEYAMKAGLLDLVLEGLRMEGI